MKRFTFFLSAILFSQIAFSQFTVKVLDIVTNDLVYDSKTDRIYVTIPSSNGANGNSIGIINPNTKQLENTVFIGSEPTVMAISDDGKYIYTGFSGTSTVRKFIVSSQQADIQFPLGSDNFSGPFYAYDICVMPNNPNTIAVSRIVKNSTGFYGTAIYDSGVVRPVNTDSNNPHNDSYVIGFYNDSIMFGYNNHSTGYDFNILKVDTFGVKEIDNFGCLVTGWNIDNFVVNEKKLYFDYGNAVDVTNMAMPYVTGTFSKANGPVAYDNYKNLVCYVTNESYGGKLTLKKYNPNNFLIQSSYDILEATGDVRNFITCGNGKYAFNTSEGKLVLLTEKLNGIINSDRKISIISVFPNPSTNYISINNPEHKDFVSFTIFDLRGAVVLTSKFSSEEPIDISNLQKGIYLIKVIDSDNNEYIEKLFKE